MTLIATIGFPEEVFIIGDSRASYPNNTLPPRDELKKVYQLSSHLCLAYTSGDVKFTFQLIESITRFATKYPQVRTHLLIRLITDFAKKEYQKLSVKLNKQPKISFIYAGVTDLPLKEKKNRIKELLIHYRNKSSMPEKLKNLRIDETQKYVFIPPPTPILTKQHFPDGHTSSTKGWDYTVLGSGRKFLKEIDQYFTKLFFFPGGFGKGIILNDLCNQFIADSNVDSIGGIAQIFMINGDGVKPIMFEENNNSQVKRKMYIDEKGDWVEEKDGKIRKSTQNPSNL